MLYQTIELTKTWNNVHIHNVFRIFSIIISTKLVKSTKQFNNCYNSCIHKSEGYYKHRNKQKNCCPFFSGHSLGNNSTLTYERN